MDFDDIELRHHDVSDFPSGLLCSEASTLSDKVIFTLGHALEEHRCVVTHKLDLSSDIPLPDALYKWCQKPGSTVFVLRGLLKDMGRADLIQRLARDMLSMSLYLVVEEKDEDSGFLRRQFHTVTTHCDASLASALDKFLCGSLSGYQITGPESWVSWSTQARELKGKQVTIGRYVETKTGKAVYGCNNNNNNNNNNCEAADLKANFIQPTKGMSELKGPYTIGGDDDRHVFENRHVKRAQTMPTVFNIPPGDSSDQLHAIDDLKPTAVSPALSADSVTSNMAAMNTLPSLSTTTSLSVVGQGGYSCPLTSPSTASVVDEFTIDENTSVKMPAKQRDLATSQATNVKTIAIDAIDNDQFLFRNKVMKETNICGKMPLVTSAHQGHGYVQNFQHVVFQTNQNQLSGPVVEKHQQNNLNCKTDVAAECPSSRVVNVRSENTPYQNAPVRPTSLFSRSEPVGFKEINASIEFSTEDCIDPDDDHMAVEDSDISPNLAQRFNNNPDRDTMSNLYVQYSAMISPMCEDETNTSVDTGSFSEQSLSELDPKNKHEKLHQEKATDCFKSNGETLAKQEQNIKMMQLTSAYSSSHDPRYLSQVSGSDFTMPTSSSKPSPYVHTPPPSQLDSPDPLPPTYLDVTSMHGQDFHPRYSSGTCQSANWDQHGAVCQSHTQTIAHTTSANHRYPPNVQNQHGRPFGMQMPPCAGHQVQYSSPSRCLSTVSEPVLRYRSPLRQTTRSANDNGDHDRCYLTPVEYLGHNPPSHAQASLQAQALQHARMNESPDTSQYNYIDNRHIQLGRHHQIPNRNPPPPPRPQMSLDDQLAKILGWCPNETDKTIERTMSEFRRQNGYYIIWRSRSKERFVIAVSHRNEIFHLLIEQERLTPRSDRFVYYLYRGGFQSESLLDLVNHYIAAGVRRRLNDSPLKTKEFACEHIRLRRPLEARKVHLSSKLKE